MLKPPLLNKTQAHHIGLISADLLPEMVALSLLRMVDNGDDPFGSDALDEQLQLAVV
jgi:hypothetical protein